MSFKSKQKQKGGFLEPVQAVPKFHYTQSDARKAWTKMVYPYAPYFFNMFREIPWDEWRYEDKDLVAKCNSKTPYVIIGGAACELLNKVYGAQLPERARLHTHTDPTGDIDVLMPGIVIQSKKKTTAKRSREYTYFSDHKGTMLPYTRSYTIWLLDQIEAYFKKLSYNFAEWFPTATDFVYSANKEAALAEADTARVVGPFHIYLSVFPQDVGEEAHMKIQVSMAHIYDGISYHQHLIEILPSWDSPGIHDLAYPHIKLDTLGLIVCRPEGELRRNEDGITNRINFISNNKRNHKIKNHFGRAIFLINLLNVPHFYDVLSEGVRTSISYIYMNGLETAAKKDEAKGDAIKMLKLCPHRFKKIGAVYDKYKKLCEDTLKMTLEDCGLSAAESPKAGGARRTRRRRRS